MKIGTPELRRIIREEMGKMVGAPNNPDRFLHGFDDGHPGDDEGRMVKTRMLDICDMAEEVCDMLETGDQLPAWVQDLVAGAHRDMEHVKDYLAGTERLEDHSHSRGGMGEGRKRKKRDLNHDNKNDFEDVMIARHLAGGMPYGKAVEKGEKAAKKGRKK